MDQTTLNLRSMDPTAVAAVKRAAAMRGMTHAEYVARLTRLHDVIRNRADSGDDALDAELRALGLETVRG